MSDKAYFVSNSDFPRLTISAADLTSTITLQDADGVIARGENPEELVANIRAALAEARAEGAREALEKLADDIDKKFFGQAAITARYVRSRYQSTYETRQKTD